MDPNATLEVIRSLVERVQARPNVTAMDADAHELANALGDLDNWLTGKGSLPHDWL